ncbi:hypothetical protein BU17DRAFT_62823 [Hysterangium stoloniferum]|nr:hypothetical protein BU17DRAFT_62823 [Hysterangium stoloniferum]
MTSSIVTTIDGQATTIATVFPTILNSPASTTTTGSHTGVIAGAAIAGTLLILLLLTGIFVVRRRRVRRQAAFSHRSLPSPRSGLLADDDVFGPAEGPSSQQMYSVPPLMRIRAAETGSLFHEGVWPPPGERSRLEDPILTGSNVDLTSIVDSVMGMDGDPHVRWSSADSGGSNTPLLGNFADRPVGSKEASPKLKGRLGLTPSGSSETTPLNPSGHAHQASLDSNGDSPTLGDTSLPPGAATPVAPSRWRSARSTQTTGTLPPTEARPSSSGLGQLVVVNNTPDVEAQEPLVDLTSKQERPASEIPPLYHMIRRDTDDGWKTPLQPTVVQAPIAEENNDTVRIPGVVAETLTEV